MKLTQRCANCHELIFNDGVRVLLSYGAPVVYFWEGKYWITNKKHSKTTSKHISTYVGNEPWAQVSQENLDLWIEAR